MNENELKEKYKTILPYLSEKQKRIFLSVEAKYFGYGGVTKVSRISGVSRMLLTQGIKELDKKIDISIDRSRKSGGGRKKVIEKYPEAKKLIKQIIEPHIRGEPESALQWTSKSLRKISQELKLKDCPISHRAVGEILKSEGFSLMANSKTNEGGKHPDRNKQFLHIHKKIIEFQKDGNPVISVDAKKKN